MLYRKAPLPAPGTVGHVYETPLAIRHPLTADAHTYLYEGDE
jgi:hypothetical protein